MRFNTLLTGLMVLGAGLVGSSELRGETYAVEQFGMNRKGATAEDLGWSSGWIFGGQMKLGRNGVEGRAGTADRWGMRTIFLSEEGEYFFRVQMKRSGADYDEKSDYASFSLMQGARVGSGVPAVRVGISTREVFEIAIGNKTATFGKVKDGGTYVFVGRLRVGSGGGAQLDAWVESPMSGFPKRAEKPDASVTGTVKGISRWVRCQTGNRESLDVEFQEIRIATTWEEVASRDAGECPPFVHKWRRFKPVMVEDEGVHPLSTHFGTVSLLAGAKGEAPAVFLSSGLQWVPDTRLLFRAADAELVKRAKPSPNVKLPLYAKGEQTDLLYSGKYMNVARAGGGFDVYGMGRLARVGRVGVDGKFERLAEELPAGLAGGAAGDREKVLGKMKGDGADFFIGDLDGDGVPDLLIGKALSGDEKWTYWPRRVNPWQAERSQNVVGPHEDLEVTEGFRGYDIMGNWLGTRRTAVLNWAKGARDAKGELSFGEERPVYFGRDDFQVQWRSWSARLSPGVMELGGKRHVVLVGGGTEVVVLPVLESGDGEARVGKAVRLLKESANLDGANLPGLVDILDVDGDGRAEVVISSGCYGRVTVLGGGAAGEFEVLGTLETVGGPLLADTLTVIARGDWDGDGWQDLITGDASGYYLFWPGTKDAKVYGGCRFITDAEGVPLLFRGRKNLQGPHEQDWGYTQPAIFDWDGDGVPELLGNDNTSTLRLFKKVDKNDPCKVSEQVMTRNGRKLGIAWRSRVGVVPGGHELAGKGDRRPMLLWQGLDQKLWVGLPVSMGSVEIGKAGKLKYVDGSEILLSGFGGTSGRVQLSVVDWDGDGKWDIVFGNSPDSIPLFYRNADDLSVQSYLGTSSMFWLRNVGTNERPLFEKARRFRFKDGGIPRVEAHGFAPVPADVDGDGSLDLIAGDGPGFVYYFLRGELDWSR